MKNVAPNLYFVRIGRATVKCDFAESSNVSTTSRSGIGSSANAGEVRSRAARAARGARVMVSLRVSLLQSLVKELVQRLGGRVVRLADVRVDLVMRGLPT